MREAVFWKAARETFDTLSAKDQADVTYLVLLLERDPEVDHVIKRDFPVPPLMFRLLAHMGWQIIYYVPDNSTVVIRAIARA